MTSNPLPDRSGFVGVYVAVCQCFAPLIGHSIHSPAGAAPETLACRECGASVPASLIVVPGPTQVASDEQRASAICGRLLVGQGDDTYDPMCVLPAGHAGICKPEASDG